MNVLLDDIDFDKYGKGEVLEDRVDVAEADEDGGEGEGRDGIATYET